jgi:hypothetical protein
VLEENISVDVLCSEHSSFDRFGISSIKDSNCSVVCTHSGSSLEQSFFGDSLGFRSSVSPCKSRLIFIIHANKYLQHVTDYSTNFG